MKLKVVLYIHGLALFVFFFLFCVKVNASEIEIFVGTASKPPIDEIIKIYEQETKNKVLIHYGGSGKILSEMKLAKRGDIYIPGSSDYMILASKEKLVDLNSQIILAYLIPTINVRKGNTHKIVTLFDLGKQGIRVGIARPDSVCVGLYGAEVLENAKLAESVKKNIVVNVESCEKTAQIMALGQVDAVLGWDVFSKWSSEIETVYLQKNQIKRIGYIPAAISNFSKNKTLSASFMEFLKSKKVKDIFTKWGYITSESEARKFASESAQIGGEWTLPDSWKK